MSDAIAQYGSVQAVATLLGVSRTQVSLAYRGKYNASTENIAAKVLETFGEGIGPVSCPYLGREIDARECRKFRERPVPMSHASELQHWKACHSCPVPGERKEE